MSPAERICRNRSWLAIALLLAGSGAASAAPLPPAFPSANATIAPLLWRVQAPRGSANAASVSLEILPGPTVNIGGKVSFGVTARKPGYLILVDVDAEGRMSQIFPTAELLAQSAERDMNLVKPGVQFVVPTPAAQQRGFEYVVAPPTGSAVIVAILSERRVQLLDLPDIQRKLQEPADTLSYLSDWTRELRVPDSGSGKLMPNNWSFDIKSYAIK
ncbi:DUF4384 domain-containing protein [Bradyrhizobium tropiciagri]|uniref:DUF4384 domain-containing protein n=1 Tax=Bradyrhizobium tropiciagri TaxID=312253 RepID=UPI001BA75F8D|nr:DUF4384 domain-containing protein [Bradyrhizobium tropiciagri]MBR0869395.1 DUF4384 domain-containing protein [Bradyrhizobium tropiciagri]